MSDVTCRRPIAWNSFALTDVGCVRKVNEDSLIDVTEKNIWAVADGMGGHQVGDVASQKVIEQISYVKSFDRIADQTDALEDALLTSNFELRDYAKNALNNQTLGTTAVCFFIKNNVGVCLWIGDSRLYRMRGKSLQRLTRDHSQVEEMVRQGLISSEEAETHELKNVITRAVGVEDQIYIDINVFSVQLGDSFLLCSDGLYNAVPANVIESHLISRDIAEAGNGLMQAALDAGAKDNVSLIVIKGEPGKIR